MYILGILLGIVGSIAAWALKVTIDNSLEIRELKTKLDGLKEKIGDLGGLDDMKREIIEELKRRRGGRTG
jgi:hypothetical protein